MSKSQTSDDGLVPPIPEIAENEHFFYRTTAPSLTGVDIDAIVGAINSSKRRPTGSRIALIGKNDSEIAGNARARIVFRRLAAAVKGITRARGAAELLVCEWAQPHIDCGVAGSLFYSLVLHTGPKDYLMTTLHTEPTSSGCDELITTDLILSAGVAFVFDPTTAHCAIPVRPHQNQLLVLLQVELPDWTHAQRAQILQRLPHHAAT
jgi:hypothetical protein